MSGHSKWSTIKRKKGAIDSERSKVFQKLAKELYVAAKSGDPNPENNPGLRMVIEKAKGENMPKANIESAINKAKNAGNGENYESVRYEGYGPSGVAIMIDCLTDNKNRTAGFVRSTLTKRGGNLGTDGSVSSQGRYSTGQYGWWTDKEKTLAQLLEYIDKGESVTTEPVYVRLDTGYTYRGFDSARSAEGDIGNTYIEVDLSAQHMWYYENGEIKFETDQIVSGKASDPKRKTPEGVYSVYTKNTNYTMVAADGSYTARCAYFLRVSFEGIGFDDLSRSAYGGNIYLTNGSHGCINMKYDEVKKLYEMVERGTPVIMYY